MGAPKIQESELRVMNLLWEHAPRTAAELANQLAESVGWSRNTTYTVITKLVKKGIVERTDPGFVCRPLIGRDAVRIAETQSLVEKFFSGSRKLLFTQMIEQEEFTDRELEELRELIDRRREHD